MFLYGGGGGGGGGGHLALLELSSCFWLLRGLTLPESNNMEKDELNETNAISF